MKRTLILSVLCISFFGICNGQSTTDDKELSTTDQVILNLSADGELSKSDLKIIKKLKKQEEKEKNVDKKYEYGVNPYVYGALNPINRVKNGARNGYAEALFTLENKIKNIVREAGEKIINQ